MAISIHLYSYKTIIFLLALFDFSQAAMMSHVAVNLKRSLRVWSIMRIFIVRLVVFVYVPGPAVRRSI